MQVHTFSSKYKYQVLKIGLYLSTTVSTCTNTYVQLQVHVPLCVTSCNKVLIVRIFLQYKQVHLDKYVMMSFSKCRIVASYKHYFFESIVS